MLEGDLLQLLSCPVCGATMFAQDTTLYCNGCSATYPIVNNIPRFVNAEHSDSGQEQVRHAFATKWARQPSWGIRGPTAAIMDDWMLGVLGWESEAVYRSFLGTKRVILDAGCGNGRETARIARLNPDALIVGLDISGGSCRTK